MVTGWGEGTQSIPDVVSDDDGYATEPGVNAVEEKGINVGSFSGAKGKGILGNDTYWRYVYWDARLNRSAVESATSVLKGVYGFEESGRRGNELLRGELMKDVITYNFMRLVQFRGQIREEKEPDGA